MKLIKFILILSLTQVSACSYFFPDKEQDYVYSKELAPLEIPPELKEVESGTSALVPVTLSNTVERIEGEATPQLRVNSTFAHTWRVVGKALTASFIEITDKNRSAAIYYVQYDPENPTVEDGSFWDELVFLFGADPHQEKPYQVILIPTEEGTTIAIRDDLGMPLNQGHGMKLLDVLYATIKKDFDH